MKRAIVGSQEGLSEHRCETLVESMEGRNVLIASTSFGTKTAAAISRTIDTTGRRVACVFSREADVWKESEENGDACALLMTERSSTRQGRTKFLVEFAILRELMVDPTLASYDAIVFGNAWERTTVSDVLLSLVRKIQQHRKDLWIVLLSDAVEARSLARAFDPQTEIRILSMEDRGYPVQIYYAEKPCTDIVRDSVRAALDIHEREGPGDILVFLTGEEEVEEAVRATGEAAQGRRGTTGRELLPIPLHGNMDPSERQVALQLPPRGCRKCVFATALAENAVDVHGIVYIVDSCLSKLKVYDHATSTEEVVVAPASRAICNRRTDKAGKLRPGKCYRLCTEKDFLKLLPADHPPEIQRSDLVWVLLILKTLGIEDLVRYEWLTPPPTEAIVQGLEMLHALRALDDDGNLTYPLGTHMAELPLEPMMSRAILAAGRFGCTEELVVIAAMHMTERIWNVPFKDRRSLEEIKGPFAVEEGDHITYLNVFNSWVRAGRSPSWCDEFGILFKSLRKADHIRTHLNKHLKRIKVPCGSACTSVEPILKALVAGFFPNACTLQRGVYGDDGQPVFRSFRGGSRVQLQPTSALYGSEPDLILYTKASPSQGVHYVRDVAAIKAEWLTEMASHYFAHRG